MLAGCMRQRLLPLALALLLLVTQQLGLLHLLQHGLDHRAPAAPPGLVAGAPASPAPAHAEATEPADGLCAVCLVLASLATAALPGDAGWPLAAAHGEAPPAAPANAAATPAGVPYLARAPPALLT